jgi:putative ABC transport system permease protein
MSIDTLLSVMWTSLELGAVYGIAVLGLVMSFRITGCADLTMESSFTTGAAVNAVWIVAGLPAPLALLAGAGAGAIAGFCTASLHVRGGIKKLLSGIIMMTVLFSVNLRIMGRSNLPILGLPAVTDAFESAAGRALFMLAAFGSVLVATWYLLSTPFGHLLRATGESPRVVTKLGRNTAVYTVIGLMLANSLVALSGGLVAQSQGFSDVGMGVGLIVSAFASLVIGEALLPPHNVPRLLAGALVGCVIYQSALAIGLRLGISPWDLKIATGALLALAVIGKGTLGKSDVRLNIGTDSL